MQTNAKQNSDSNVQSNQETSMTAFIQNFLDYTNTLPQYKSEYQQDHIDALEEIYTSLSANSKESPVSDIPLEFKLEKLTLSNFGNYEKESVDFIDQNLFSVIGNVGSGKTTLFDGVYFAMTSSSHKFGARNNRQAMIRKGQTSGAVTLELTINHESVVITRKLKLNAANGLTITSALEYKGQRITGERNVQQLLNTLFPLTADQMAFLLFIKQGDLSGIFGLGDTTFKSLLIPNVLNLELYRSIHKSLSTTTREAIAKSNTLAGHVAEAKKSLQEALMEEEISLEAMENLKIELSAKISNGESNIGLLRQSIANERAALESETLKLGNKTLAKLRSKTVSEKKSHCPVCHEEIGDAFHQLVHQEADSVKKIESIQEKLNQFLGQLESEEQLLKSLNMELKETTGKSSTLNSLQTRIDELSIEEANHKRFVESITILRNCFANHGESFEKYLTTQFLNSLCNRTSKWIGKLTGKSTEVSYSADSQFSFSVSGQGMRSHQSYSGGEQTLFALGIQLAAREFFSEKANIKLNTLFIDEGFHTFNKQIDIHRLVETLSNHDMMIGIITHNHDLASQLPNVLTVQNGSAVWTK
jgi:DNA repair exonuclease SbcCD ATPase subunit